MSFNAEAFLNQTIEEPMSTKTLVCPEGEFRAFVDDGDKAIQFREFAGKDGNPPSFQCVVLFSILDESVKTFLKREKALVPMNVWLDMKEDGSGLDLSEGKNVGLGRLRKALNQNSGAWSPLMMKGKGPVMIKVGQRADKNDPEVKYAEVTRVAGIS